MPQRRALADVRTLQLGQQIEEQKTARKEKTVRVGRMKSQARRLDIPAVMVEDDPENARALALFAEAEREHQHGRKQEAATPHAYQLDPDKMFTPEPGKLGINTSMTTTRTLLMRCERSAMMSL
jgi:hypothetical protein